MTKIASKHEKILIRYFSNVRNEIVVKTMWAKTINNKKGIYKLDNIPFYGPQIATGDEFYAEYVAEEKMLTYKRITKFSGNSVVLVLVIQEDYDKTVLRNQFKKMNCTSEGFGISYFSMEILKTIDYSKIKKILESYELEGVIEYSEPYLSDKHRLDISSS